MSLTWGHLRAAGISEHQHEQLLSTQKYLALLDLHFWEQTRDSQGQATRRSKPPSLSQLSLWAWSTLGFCAESCKKLSWDTAEERKDGVQGKPGDRRPRSPGIWLKHRQAPKEPWGTRGRPHGAPAPAARSVWLPAPWLRPPDQTGKTSSGLSKVRKRENSWPSWRFGFQCWSRWPRSPELSRESFSLLSEPLSSPSSRNQAALVRTGALLGRPQTVSFALCRNKPSVQNYGQMNTDLHWYSNGITVLFSQISNEQMWAMLFVLVLKLTLQNLKYTLPFFFMPWACMFACRSSHTCDYSDEKRSL